MQTSKNLLELLKRIDHRSYPAYRETSGKYQFDGYILSIDHVQGDPFASPSRVSVIVEGKSAGFPAELYEGRHRRIAQQKLFDGHRSIAQIAQQLSELLAEKGFTALCGGYVPVNMAYVRPQEIAACLNRSRNLRL